MIRLENVSFHAAGENGDVEILKDINLTLDFGKFYVITGPNGGGKSSLAKIIMGIYRPTRGRIYLDSKDITDLDVTERARLGIGFAFQHPPRFKGLTVGRLLEIAGWDPGTDPKCSFLKIVGLCPQDYLEREIDDSLSGGELKRIEIATLLAKKPLFSVYDEPEAGIDLWSFTRLTETFRNFHEDNKNGGMLIISHQEKIMELADEIILVADGTVTEEGMSKDALKGMLNDDIYCDFTCDKEIRYGKNR